LTQASESEVDSILTAIISHKPQKFNDSGAMPAARAGAKLAWFPVARWGARSWLVLRLIRPDFC